MTLTHIVSLTHNFFSTKLDPIDSIHENTHRFWSSSYKPKPLQLSLCTFLLPQAQKVTQTNVITSNITEPNTASVWHILLSSTSDLFSKHSLKLLKEEQGTHCFYKKNYVITHPRSFTMNKGTQITYTEVEIQSIIKKHYYRWIKTFEKHFYIFCSCGAG